jgi:hypothetical protein
VNFKPVRIRPIPRRMARCTLCGHIRDCAAYDHDLRGEICEDTPDQPDGCEFAVINAEHALHDARLAISTDSILEGGL